MLLLPKRMARALEQAGRKKYPKKRTPHSAPGKSVYLKRRTNNFIPDTTSCQQLEIGKNIFSKGKKESHKKNYKSSKPVVFIYPILGPVS